MPLIPCPQLKYNIGYYIGINECRQLQSNTIGNKILSNEQINVYSKMYTFIS
jgi:hypothetical protein